MKFEPLLFPKLILKIFTNVRWSVNMKSHYSPYLLGCTFIKYLVGKYLDN